MREDKLWGLLKKYRTYIAVIGIVALLYGVMFYFGISCPIKYLTGISCPACGMTRAALCLVRLDLSGAFFYHPLVFLLPIFAGAYIFFSVKRMKRARDITLISVAVIFFAVYLIRMLFGGGEVVVCSPENSVFHSIFT